MVSRNNISLLIFLNLCITIAWLLRVSSSLPFARSRIRDFFAVSTTPRCYSSFCRKKKILPLNLRSWRMNGGRWESKPLFESQPKKALDFYLYQENIEKFNIQNRKLEYLCFGKSGAYKKKDNSASIRINRSRINSYYLQIEIFLPNFILTFFSPLFRAVPARHVIVITKRRKWKLLRLGKTYMHGVLNRQKRKMAPSCDHTCTLEK